MRLRSSLLPVLAVALFLTMGGSSFARVEGDVLTSHVFQLRYRENLCESNAVSGGGVYLKILPHPTPFAKEPVLDNANFFRGVIPLSKTPSRSVGLIWDKVNMRLYVDTNRNGDLTDDSSNPIKAEEGTFSQGFRNICVDSLEGAQHGRWNVSIFLAESAPFIGSLAMVSVMSAWSGEIQLNGRKWELAVQDNLDGKIGPGDRMFLEEPGFFRIPRSSTDWTITLLREQFSPSAQVWVDGRPYDLAFHLGPGDEGGILTVTFRDAAVPSQECEIAGTGIARLDFRQGRYGENTTGTVAVFQRPGRSIRLAPGEYHPQIRLDRGPGLGTLFSDGRNLSVKVKSDPTSHPLLNFGGPLKPEISARRNRANLDLTCTLRGMGGERYETDLTSATIPLGFTISKGTRQLASGDLRPG